MSGQPPTSVPAPQAAAAASQVSWDRQNAMLAKNKFAYNQSETPTLQFKFNTPPVAQQQPSNQTQPVDSTPLQPALQSTSSGNSMKVLPPPVPAVVQTFSSQQSQEPQQQPVLSRTPSQTGAPVFIVQIQNWAAYHNPQYNRPYFYNPTTKVNTYDTPQEISAEFSAQYSVFLSKYNHLMAPQPLVPAVPVASAPMITKKVAPPPNFTMPSPNPHVISSTGNSGPPPFISTAMSRNNSGALPLTNSNNTAHSQEMVHSSRPPIPPTPAIPPTGNNASSQSIVHPNLSYDHFDSLSTTESALTVANIPSPLHHNTFSFPTHIANPPTSTLPKLHVAPPPFTPSIHSNTSLSLHGESLPEQHPLASLYSRRHQSGTQPSIVPPNRATPLAIPTGDDHDESPVCTPTNAVRFPLTSTHAASITQPKMYYPPKNIPASTTAAASSSFHAPHNPLFDPSIPFAQLLKIDALPTQKDGTFLKLTTGFRKAWKPRYVILHAGAFRYWDDLAQANKQMSSPNAIVSVVGCSVQLPPLGSGVHPKNGLLIDGLLGEPKDVLTKTEDNEEQTQFFIKTERLGEADSWIHVLYRNGVVDARYVLNPDLTATNENVEANVHHLFDVWSRERVGTETIASVHQTPTAALIQHKFNTPSSSSQSTPRNEGSVPGVTCVPVAAPAPVTDLPGTTGLDIDPPKIMKGMYTFGGLYKHQPIPVPIHVNGNNKLVYAVLFTDRIESYETYEEALLVARYHNPDTNNSIIPEQYHSHPKIAHLISITRDTTIELQLTPTALCNMKISVGESKFRKVKKQDWVITFENCNPMTGHHLPTMAPPDPNLPPGTIPGSSLSVAQKWFTVISYCIEGPLGGVFGVRLWWSITRSTIPIPNVLHTCFRFISQKGLGEEGILRVPGNNADIIQLRRMFDGCLTDSTVNEPNTAAGLFKLFLRENVDGIIPMSMYKQFTSLNCRAAGAGASAEKRQPLVIALKALVQTLPPLNLMTLSYVIYILTKISANASNNKMYPKNCAMVVNGNLFVQPRPVNPQGLLSNTKNENFYANPQQMAETLAEQEAVVLIMIEHFNEIFPRGSPFIF